MIWLIGLVLILEAGFHWFLKPLITFSTPLFEFHSLQVLILLFAIWLFAGSKADEHIG